MTSPNNWRPLPGVTNLRFRIPVGPSGSDPWWCWALYPVLAIPVFVFLIFQFGWRKKK